MTPKNLRVVTSTLAPIRQEQQALSALAMTTATEVYGADAEGAHVPLRVLRAFLSESRWQDRFRWLLTGRLPPWE